MQLQIQIQIHQNTHFTPARGSNTSLQLHQMLHKKYANFAKTYIQIHIQMKIQLTMQIQICTWCFLQNTSNESNAASKYTNRKALCIQNIYKLKYKQRN